MSKYLKVLLPLPFDEPFDYAMPENLPAETILKPLDYIQVTFRGKKLWGIITSISDSIDEKLKNKVKSAIQPLFINGENIPVNIEKSFFEFLKWQAEYYLEPFGEVLKLAMPGAKFFEANAQKREPKGTFKPYQASLNAAQQTVYENIEKRVSENNFNVTLIDGVTGSGKTEVYFKLISKIISEGKQALVLLPEIMLTNQVIKRFQSHFGIKPSVWHSHITMATKRDNWLKAVSGEGQIFIGARSSLMLPYKNLGIIIVDEEHDASYKQEEGTVYNARDMAVMRAKFSNINTVLVSATPSIETFINATNGKFHIEKLYERHGKAVLPETKLIDMRQENLKGTEFISHELRSEIQSCLQDKKQALLFLNRRGYAPLTLCGKCGYRFKSPDTSTWLVQHHHPNGDIWLECHHTGYRIKLPDTCPECKEKDSFRPCGPGVQRIAEEAKKLFPDSVVEIITSDTISTPKKAAEIVRRIEEKEIDIIIGTQMIAKGHNFPALTLVGIIDGDLGLEGADIRAGERCFQVLQQVSGRAGRADDIGKVFIQTYLPEHPVMQALKNNDREKFYNYEIKNRQISQLPPFAKLAALIISSKSEAESMRAANAVISALPYADGIKKFGPVNSMIYLLRGNYRNRILIKADRNISLQKYLKINLSGLTLPNSVKLKIDIDPYSFI